METGAAPYGPEGTQARALLAERGLTPEVVGDATGLLSSIAFFSKTVTDDRSTEVRQAEEAMWQWYLEWSAIARQAISSHSILRSLGFRHRSRNDASEHDVEETELLEADASPTESSVGLIEAPQLAAVNDQTTALRHSAYFGSIAAPRYPSRSTQCVRH